jgi:membrane-bound lytic murein transglycosylase A
LTKLRQSKHPIPSPMKKFKPAFLLALLCVSGIFFHNFTLSEKEIPVVCLDLPTEVFSPVNRNGKLESAEKKEAVFTQTSWDQLGFPVLTEDIVIALQHQLRILENSDFTDGKSSGNNGLTYQGMKEVLELLINRAGTQPNDLHQYLDAWQSWGDDKRSNVYFTGYYTPAMKVKKKKDKTYKYPLYAFPEDWNGKLPSRAEIDGKGALEGKGLELAYASNPIDIYVMQLQGSGTVEFVDTKERMLFRYAGENGHRYRNIQHFFKKRDDLSISNVSMTGIRRFLAKHPQLRDTVLFYNPSYTFFTPKTGLAKGAGEVPLMEGISIAADPRYFPMGSVVLAALPVFSEGKVSHHEYRILLPQDVGGAIKGAGHVDVYCGNGDFGRKKAASLHHYGRLWVLKPKKNEQMAMLD